MSERPTMTEYSESRIGQEWRPEDHTHLLHHLQELNRTAIELAQKAASDAKKRNASPEVREQMRQRARALNDTRSEKLSPEERTRIAKIAAGARNPERLRQQAEHARKFAHTRTTAQERAEIARTAARARWAK